MIQTVLIGLTILCCLGLLISLIPAKTVDPGSGRKQTKPPFYKKIIGVKGLSEAFYVRYKKEYSVEFYLTLSALVVLSLLFLYFGFPLLTVIIFFGGCKYVQGIIYLTVSTNEELMQEKLPESIDEMIKELRRTDNLHVALDDASHYVESPVKERFIEISSKMTTENNTVVLRQESQRYQNSWIRQFFFILMKLSDNVDRKTALGNLEELSHLVRKENDVLAERVSKNKSNVRNGLIVASVAVIIGLVLLLIPQTRAAYFGTFVGFIAFIFAWAAILFTIYFSVKMNHAKNTLKGGD